MFMNRFTLLACVLVLSGLTGCKRAEPDQLVWLAPASPCEAGDPGFGTEYCFVRRMRDAVVVLRVPAKYGQAGDGAQHGYFSAEDVVFTPTGVLTSGKDGNAWLAEMNAIRARKSGSKGGGSHSMQSLGWGWRIQDFPGGHAAAMRQMESDSKSPSYGDGAAFIPIESTAPDFNVYERKACANFLQRVSSTRGRLTPFHPCEASFRYYLAKDDDRVFATCFAPYTYDDKLISRAYCSMQSNFKLRDVGGRPFIVTYTYTVPWEQMTSGHWKYVHQRFEAWIRSMDTSATELEGIKQ